MSPLRGFVLGDTHFYTDTAPTGLREFGVENPSHNVALNPPNPRYRDGIYSKAHNYLYTDRRARLHED